VQLWTFKKVPSVLLLRRSTASQVAPEDPKSGETDNAAVDEDLLVAATAAPLTLEEKESAFWKLQEARACWEVPYGNVRRMPWLADGETGMGVAMARARQQGKTPLIVDPSADSVVDHHFAFGGVPAKVLDARAMFEDEAQGTRTRNQVMKDARKLLVEAMREGKTFYIQLHQRHKTDFAGGLYSDNETLPLAVFDQRVVDTLEPFYADSEEAKDLFGSDHPLAAVLRPPDCEMSTGRFVVARGFEVVVGTLKAVDDFERDLRNVIPMMRLQPIWPRSISR
jgi:hypothetical protein